MNNATKKPLKKTTPAYKQMAGLAALLFAFSLGLLVAWLVPGAVLGLMLGFALVVLVLAFQSCYLWQVERMKEFNRKNRKQPVQRKKEVAR